MAGRSRPLPEGNVTFVLTDIEGSTPLLKRLGDDYRRILDEHNQIIRSTVAGHDVVEFDTTGDGFIFVCEDPAAALAAAVGIERALLAHAWPPGTSLRVRVGVHTGDAKVVDGDYVSIGLHQAVRVMSAAHGGQIITTIGGGALPEFVGLSSLGTYHVRDFDGPVELFEVRDPSLASGYPPPRAPSAVVQNLPAQRTTFVGRSFELGEIAKLLDTAALVTIVGPGGIGKTRLSSQVGLDVARQFDGGVWFVHLDAATDRRGIEYAVIEALGLRDEAGRSPFETIRERVRTARTLLILDNCEQLVDACARFVDALVDASESVSVLATSREPFQIASEHVFRLSPLPVPASDDVGADEVAAFPSVELFIARARQVAPDFALDTTTGPVIARICRTVDGIPLAIELAAARVGDFGIEALGSGIDDALLDLSRRGGLEWQRSLRATIEWSVRLLNDEQLLVFRRLAPFLGGFTAESAAEVTGVGEGTERIIWDLVVSSLAEHEPDGDSSRFRLLEPIRHYARDELDAVGERETVDDAFLAWAFELVNQADGIDLGRFRALTDAEVTNISAAFHLALERGNGAVASDLSVWFAFYAEVRGHWREAVSRLSRVLELEPDPFNEGNLRIARADIVKRLGRLAEAEEDLARALTVLREIKHERMIAGCLMSYAQVVRQSGRFEEARKLYGEAYEATRDLGIHARSAVCLADLGIIAQLDDLPASRRFLEEAYKIRDQLNDDLGRGSCLLLLGNGAIVEGDLDGAESLYTRAQELMQQVGYRAGIAAADKGFGIVAQSRGDPSTTRDFYVRALDEFISMGEPVQTAQCRAHLATIELAEGRFETALQGMADSLPVLVGPLPHFVALFIDPLAVAYADRDPPRAARAAGALTTLLSAPLLVNTRKRLASLRATDALQAKLGAERFAAEYSAGARQSWEELIEDVTTGAS